MTDGHGTVLVTDEQLDLICKTLPLKDEASRKWFADVVSFGVREHLGDNCIASGMRTSEAKRQLLQLMEPLRSANQRLDSLNPLLRVFLFKCPAGMTEADVKEWFGPKVLFPGNGSRTSIVT